MRPRGPRQKRGRELLGGDQGDLAGHALPGLALLDPGVYEAFAMDGGFALVGFPDAEDTGGDRGVAVHARGDLFIDSLGRLILRIANAGQELRFVREAAVY